MSITGNCWSWTQKVITRFEKRSLSSTCCPDQCNACLADLLAPQQTAFGVTFSSLNFVDVCITRAALAEFSRDIESIELW